MKVRDLSETKWEIEYEVYFLKRFRLHPFKQVPELKRENSNNKMIATILLHQRDLYPNKTKLG